MSSSIDTDMPAAALFADVIGQADAVSALRAAARRPVHAYLFLGAEGSGVRPAARAFAAALLCPNGGCGTCRTCRLTLAGNHPDLIVVERTGAAVGIDDARRLVALAQRRPFEAERQVLVVADVHLALRSAPALLKTVEEPPPATVFVLLAETIPPELVTVASRCAQITFPPVAPGVITDWLVERDVELERAVAVAEDCGGDVERARLLAEDPGFLARHEQWRSVPDRLTGEGAVVASLTSSLLAAADEAVTPLRNRHAEQLAQLEAEAESLKERGVPGRREILERQHREERRWRTDEIRAGLGVLARSYRDRLTKLVAQTPGSPAQRLEIRQCCAASDAITAAVRSFERNPNEALLLESLFVQLASDA
jgi:DNA polymerase III subunit delta'